MSLIFKVHSSESSFAYRSYDIDNSFNLKQFKEDFKIQFIEQSPDEDGGSTLVFDMIGVDAAIANALRRIIIAEIPTMAIEKVYIYNNTSLIQDEVLSHRLGLIPLRADPMKFVPLQGEDFTTDNTFVLELKVACERVPGVPDTAPDDEKYINSKGPFPLISSTLEGLDFQA
jgi:DNA-directed RNA polymerase I and III subunit RPAC1